MDRRRLSIRALADARRVRCRRRRAGHIPPRVPLLAHVPAGQRLPALALHDLPQRLSAVARARAPDGRARRDRGRRCRRPTPSMPGPPRRASTTCRRGSTSGPAIDVALAKIPEPFRSTLIIVDVEDQSYESAAETLGVPIGTVRSRLFRGRRLMQEQLQHVRDGRGSGAQPAELRDAHARASADRCSPTGVQTSLRDVGTCFAVQREAGFGDDVRRERRRDRAVALVRELNRALGVLALDPGAVDAVLDIEVHHATRRLRATLGGDVNAQSLDRRLALGDDVDDVDGRARRERVEQRLDRTGRFLGVGVDAMRASGRPASNRRSPRQVTSLRVITGPGT